MRHLGSLVAALIITPLAWVLLALGQPRAGDTFARWGQAETVRTGQLLPALGFLVGAGVLIGLVACLRWSPLGPLVAGATLLGGYGYLLARPYPLLDRLPVWKVGDLRIDTAVPLENGTLAVLGAALVVATVSGQRWRRWPTVAAATTETPPAPAGPETYRPAAPSGGPDGYPPAGGPPPGADAPGRARPAGGGVGTALAEHPTERTEEPVTGAGVFLTRGAAERLRTADRPVEPVPEPRVPEQVSPGWPVWTMPVGENPTTAEDLLRRPPPDLPRRTPTPADAPGTIAAASTANHDADPADTVQPQPAESEATERPRHAAPEPEATPESDATATRRANPLSDRPLANGEAERRTATRDDLGPWTAPPRSPAE
jgi:hypothetical protein